MKTEEQIKDELIEYYKLRIEELKGQVVKLKATANALERSFHVNPNDVWYLEYLKKENASLARECDARQQVVETYQRHYSKWGTFYKEYENR